MFSPPVLSRSITQVDVLNVVVAAMFHAYTVNTCFYTSILVSYHTAELVNNLCVYICAAFGKSLWEKPWCKCLRPEIVSCRVVSCHRSNTLSHVINEI